ncbi:hypothetical protein BDW62DRAFT_106273 [Aspergillus aurantiobrunneus]
MHNTSSPQETITLRTRDLALVTILRLQGSFDESLRALECRSFLGLRDKTFRQSGLYKVVLSEMAGVQCELGGPHIAARLLRDELRSMAQNSSVNSGAGRRLRIALVATYLQRNMLDEAEQLLLDLQSVLDSPNRLDYIRQYSNFIIWM